MLPTSCRNSSAFRSSRTPSWLSACSAQPSSTYWLPPALPRRNYTWATSHGDFKPGNLLVGDERLTGIDVALLYSGPCVDDIAYFLNHGLLILWSSGRVGFQAFSNERLQRAFVQGYEMASGRKILPCLWHGPAYMRACGCYSSGTRRSGGPKSLLSIVALRILVRRLTQTLHEAMGR